MPLLAELGLDPERFSIEDEPDTPEVRASSTIEGLDPERFEVLEDEVDESTFRQWYGEKAKNTGLNPDPDDPQHRYDYRAAFGAGAEPEKGSDGQYHWPSQFKADDHPNRFVDGQDTKTGERIPVIRQMPESEIGLVERGRRYLEEKGWVEPKTRMDPSQIAEAQIRHEAKGLPLVREEGGQGMTPDDISLLAPPKRILGMARDNTAPYYRPATTEEYKQQVYPEGTGLRRAEQYGRDIGAGFTGVSEGLAGMGQWLTGGMIGNESANAARLLREELQAEDPNFADQVASGVGSMVAFFGPGIGVSTALQATSKVAPFLAKALGTTVMSATEAGTEAGLVYRNSLERNRDPERAESEASTTFLLNMPLLWVTNKLAYFSDVLKNPVAKRILGGIMEGTQESGQEVISTKAQGEELKLKDVMTSGAVGSIIGVFFGGGGAASQKGPQGLQRRPSETDNAPTDMLEPTEMQASQGIPGNIPRGMPIPTMQEAPIEDLITPESGAAPIDMLEPEPMAPVSQPQVRGLQREPITVQPEGVPYAEGIGTQVEERGQPAQELVGGTEGQVRVRGLEEDRMETGQGEEAVVPPEIPPAPPERAVETTLPQEPVPTPAEVPEVVGEEPVVKKSLTTEPPAEVVKGKEAWEMTAEEHRKRAKKMSDDDVREEVIQVLMQRDWTREKAEKYIQGEFSIRAMHDAVVPSGIVERAISEGKPVPQSIIDEYPGLKPPAPSAEKGETEGKPHTHSGPGYTVTRVKDAKEDAQTKWTIEMDEQTRADLPGIIGIAKDATKGERFLTIDETGQRKVIGVKSGRPEFMQHPRLKSERVPGKSGASPADLEKAVNKALAGEPLGVKQARLVEDAIIYLREMRLQEEAKDVGISKEDFDRLSEEEFARAEREAIQAESGKNSAEKVSGPEGKGRTGNLFKAKPEPWALTPSEPTKEERLAMAPKEKGPKKRAVFPTEKVKTATTGKQTGLFGNEFKPGESRDLFDQVGEVKLVLREPKKKDGFVQVFRGESTYNKGGNYYTTDREWARQFTQSGQDKEVFKGWIKEDRIYRPEPLPSATSEKEFDTAIAEAKAKGYSAVWFDEGVGEPNSVYVFNRRDFKPGTKLSIQDPTAQYLWELAHEPETPAEVQRLIDVADTIKKTIESVVPKADLSRLTVKLVPRISLEGRNVAQSAKEYGKTADQIDPENILGIYESSKDLIEIAHHPEAPLRQTRITAMEEALHRVLDKVMSPNDLEFIMKEHKGNEEATVKQGVKFIIAEQDELARLMADKSISTRAKMIWKKVLDILKRIRGAFGWKGQKSSDAIWEKVLGKGYQPHDGAKKEGTSFSVEEPTDTPESAADRLGIYFDGEQEIWTKDGPAGTKYQFTDPQTEGGTFYVKDLKDLDKTLEAKRKEFGVSGPEVRLSIKKHEQDAEHVGANPKFYAPAMDQATSTIKAMREFKVIPGGFIDNTFKTPEWSDHPVEKKVTDAALDREKNKHKYFYNIDHDQETDQNIWESLKDLKDRGTSILSRIRGRDLYDVQNAKVSKEYKQVSAAIDHMDTERHQWLDAPQELAGEPGFGETKNFHAITLNPTDQFDQEGMDGSKFKTTDFHRGAKGHEGITFIIGKDTETGDVLTHSVRFRKDTFKPEEVKAWFEENKDVFAGRTGYRSVLEKKKVSKDVLEAVDMYRRANDKALDHMRANLKEVIDAYRDAGKKLPTLFVEKDEKGKATPYTLKDAYEEMGQHRGYYAPRIRESGDWVVQSVKGDQPYRYHTQSRRKAIALEQRLIREGHKDLKRFRDSRMLPESVYEDLTIGEVAKALENAVENMQGVDPDTTAKFRLEVIQAASDMLKARAFRSHRIKRSDKVVKGYIEDPLTRHLLYTNQIAGGISKGEAAQEMFDAYLGKFENYIRDDKTNTWVLKDSEGTPLDSRPMKDEEIEADKGKKSMRFGGLSPAQDKELHSKLKDYISNQLRNPDRMDRLVGLGKSIVSFKYLGFNPRSMLVNTTAMITTVPSAIHQYAMGSKGSLTKIGASIMKAGVDYVGVMRGKKLANAQEQAFMDLVQQEGYDTPQYMHDAMGAMKDMYGGMWSNIMSKAMVPFGITEQWNRGSTMLAAYRLARGQGNTHEDAMKLAQDASNKAHGIYGQATLPTWAQGKNPAALVLRMGYTYQKFGHNYVQMLMDLGFKKRNIKALTFAMAAPMVIGGLEASLAANIVMMIVKAILRAIGEPEDPEKIVYDVIRSEFGRGWERAARYGAFGAAGVDISGSLSVGMEVPKTLMDLTGPFGGVYNDISQAAHYLTTGQPYRAVEKTLPNVASNLFTAARELRTGAVTKSGYPVWDEEGKPLQPSAVETGLKGMGFRSSRRATLQASEWEWKQMETRYADKRKKIYEQYRAYLKTWSKDKYQDIMKQIKEYNADVMSEGLQKQVPLITKASIKGQVKRMAKPTKRQMSRIMEAEEMEQ